MAINENRAPDKPIELIIHQQFWIRGVWLVSPPKTPQGVAIKVSD